MRMTYRNLCGMYLVNYLKYWNPNPRNFEIDAGSEKKYRNNSHDFEDVENQVKKITSESDHIFSVGKQVFACSDVLETYALLDLGAMAQYLLS